VKTIPQKTPHRTKRSHGRLKIFLILSILGGSPLLALDPVQIITLKNGTTIEGRPTVHEDSLWIDVEGIGVITVPKSAVASQKDKDTTIKIWKVDLAAGYTMARGNTETDELSSSGKANRKTTQNETTYQMDGFYSSSQGQMSAQRYSGSARYAYSFGDRLAWYHFFKAEGLHDRFAQIDDRFLPTTGIGYWWSDNDVLRLMAELGAGYEHTDYTEGRHRTNQAIVVPRFFVERRVLGKSRISEDLQFTAGSEKDTGERIDSQTHFVNPISGRLSLDLNLADHFDSKPPLGAKENDLVFITSLRYSF